MAESLDMKPLVEPGRELIGDEKERYSRHLLIPDLDAIGQQRILNAKVLVIGGLPFFIYSTDETPYRRKTAPYRKD